MIPRSGNLFFLSELYNECLKLNCLALTTRSYFIINKNNHIYFAELLLEIKIKINSRMKYQI